METRLLMVKWVWLAQYWWVCYFYMTRKCVVTIAKTTAVSAKETNEKAAFVNEVRQTNDNATLARGCRGFGEKIEANQSDGCAVCTQTLLHPSNLSFSPPSWPQLKPMTSERNICGRYTFFPASWHTTILQHEYNPEIWLISFVKEKFCSFGC